MEKRGVRTRRRFLRDSALFSAGLAGLPLTDGGMWETFAFKASSGEYQGMEKWTEVIELVE